MANLTTKELTGLKEQLGAEEVLVKKYEQMAELASDENIKHSLKSFASRHREHYNTMLSFLQ